MSFGALVLTAAGVVLAADPGVLALLRCDGSIVGRPFDDCVCGPRAAAGPPPAAYVAMPHPRSRRTLVLQPAPPPVLPGEGEQTWRCHDGSAVAVHVTRRWVQLQGEPGWLLTVARSSATPVVAPESLLDPDPVAAATVSKTAFINALSHELRTPLNALLGFAQLLELDDLTASQAESVEQILTGGRHLIALVSDTLDITRIESGRLSLAVEPCPVQPVCQDVLALLSVEAGNYGSRLVLSAPKPTATSPAVTALADPHRLRQILLNLVGNALKYGGPAGVVTVLVDQPAGQCVIRVQDEGPSLSEAEGLRIFEPFERLARHSTLPGSGLGLVLARDLARSMGGDLTLEPRPGPGNSFMVCLPLAVGRRPPARWAMQEGIHGRLLYVEDDEANVRLVTRILQRRPGVALTVVGSLAKAREKLAAHRYDAVLLDLQLPDGRGEELLDLDIATTFVVLSGDRSTPLALADFERRGHLRLQKPIDIDSFLSTLDTVLSLPVARTLRRAPSADPR